VKIFKPMLLLVAVWLAGQWSCSLPPMDDITAPWSNRLSCNGSVLTGQVTVAIESTDDEAVDKVWIYLDDQVQGISINQTANLN